MSKVKTRFLRTLFVNNKQAYIIVDYNFWVQNELALLKWLGANTINGEDTQEGMTLSFSNEQEELLFLLRWA